MARLILVSLVLVVSACDSITMWLAPNTSCADWQHMVEGERSSIADQIIRGSSLFEPVRVAQHVPVATPEEKLVSMAVGSVTKNCDLQSWSPAVQVKDVIRDLYVPGPAGPIT